MTERVDADRLGIVHVCVASYPPILSSHGGAIQRRVRELGRAQAALGHDVEIFSLGHRDFSVPWSNCTLTYVKCNLQAGLRHLEYLFRIAAKLKRRKRPYVLHFHSEPEGSLVSRMLTVPSVLSYDYFRFRGRTPVLHPIYRRLLRSFDLLLPCSSYCLEESKGFWNLPRSHFEVLYNGVNTDQFVPDSSAGTVFRQQLALNPESQVLLYLGRVAQQKGTDMLLEAFRRLRTKELEVELIVAGPVSRFDADQFGVTAKIWKHRMREAGARYLGPVEESDLVGLYNSADLFVMPTRELEMFGMAAVEAQACGLPVIASDHGGLRETVPLKCGGRFKTGSATDLQGALERLLADRQLRKRCRAAAIRNAQRFSWRLLAEESERLYRRIRTRPLLTVGQSSG